MGTLNEFLQPTDSPIALNQGAISSYSFDSQNERNSISAAKNPKRPISPLHQAAPSPLGGQPIN
jgi:hypothetical protein